MKSIITKLHHHIDSITKYLTPLLPLANCHMVEFLTLNHWENLLPVDLKHSIESLKLNDSLDIFWNSAEQLYHDKSHLSTWIEAARSHCVTINNDYCLSTDQLQNHIKAWGGDKKPDVKVKQFMTSKKSYEVQSMSGPVAGLAACVGAACCVEAGGGRGALGVALSLAHRVRCLSLDCDPRTAETAPSRVKTIQKQWHAIAKRVNNGTEERISEAIDKNLHRFATAFITKHTDLQSIVKEKFPEYADSAVKLILTGLHTCGNLGPDSLRLFTSQPSVAAVFNVPCCYHLLTESIDANVFDVFQRDHGSGEESCQGFPMTDYLRGYKLGRNARMLAAQSIDRVVAQRQLPSKSLLYRALLQAIIQNHRPNRTVSEGKLKRITPKCQNFQQYFKLADEILKLELFDALPDSFCTDIEKTIDCQWKKLVLFYLIRLCLAQVIESLILLDRILFLCENGFNKVYLVKLFDPILSPRCHSIVAVR